ncbi:hypothetical protein K438DRAFT_1761182 [Mycena galopus ATCC 62051]|nr:hypothetical protein K438DRAFT_1761182 [Mycena galopus ATCC 62051]
MHLSITKPPCRGRQQFPPLFTFLSCPSFRSCHPSKLAAHCLLLHLALTHTCNLPSPFLVGPPSLRRPNFDTHYATVSPFLGYVFSAMRPRNTPPPDHKSSAIRTQIEGITPHFKDLYLKYIPFPAILTHGRHRALATRSSSPSSCLQAFPLSVLPIALLSATYKSNGGTKATRPRTGNDTSVSTGAARAAARWFARRLASAVTRHSPQIARPCPSLSGSTPFINILCKASAPISGYTVSVSHVRYIDYRLFIHSLPFPPLRRSLSRHSPDDMVAGTKAGKRHTASRCRPGSRYQGTVWLELPFPTCSRPHQAPSAIMSAPFTPADFIDDHAQDSEEEEDQDDFDSQQEDDEDSHEAMARALDRRDFPDLHRIIHQFETTGMIPPPTPEGGSVWGSRSPSPLALAPPAAETFAPEHTPLVGSRVGTPLFLPGSPMSETPPAEDMVPDALPPQPHVSPAPSSQSSPVQAMLVDHIHREHLSHKERLRKKALSFLDIDAEDDEDGDRYDSNDSEGDEQQDFLDDRERISPPRLPSVFANCKTLEPEALENEAIAQHYIDKARSLQPARRSGTPLLGDADDKHRLRAVPPTPADILDHPLYMFSVPRKTELVFIDYIVKYPGIQHGMQSAFTRAIGSGAVCMETTNLKLLFKALKRYPHFVRNRTQPQKIDTLDSWFHVVLATPPIEHIDQAERLKPGEKPQKRILGLPPSTKKPLPLPQRLFDPAQFHHQYPDKKLKTAKKPENQLLFSYRKLVFRSDGLEHLSWNGDSRFFSPVEITPSEHDLKLFVAANSRNNILVQAPENSVHRNIPPPVVKRLWPDIRQRPYLGTRCALQEGDSVVVVSGEYQGRLGQIARIVDKKRTLRGTGKGGADEEVVVRYAAVQRNAATPITYQTIHSDTMFIVPINQLALQALALVRSIIPEDRVKVVNGAEARGMSARVLNISEDGLVELEPLEGSDKQVHGHMRYLPPDFEGVHLHIRYMQRDFRPGDVVNVVRGLYEGSVGFIIAVMFGGLVEILPVGFTFRDLGLVDLVTYLCDADCLRVAVDKTTSDGKIKYHYLTQDVSFSVPTTDIQFLHIDQWYPSASSNAPKTGDRLWSVEWENTERQASREFLHRSVMLVHHKKFKGYCGTVMGYTHRNPAEEPEYIVQLEARLTQVVVKMNHMQDRDTRRPLRDDDCEQEPITQTQSVPENRVVDDPVAEDPVWGTGGALIVPDIGDDNGVWLTRAELVNKRIDVEIVRVKHSKFPKLINASSTRHEGRTGYLIPLSEAAKENTLHALKPLRMTPSRKCISEEKGRVILIGPDVHGSWDRVGQYAEVMPGQSDHPKVVQVRFVKSDSDAVSPTGLRSSVIFKCMVIAIKAATKASHNGDHRKLFALLVPLVPASPADERERAVRNARVCAARAATLSDSTDTAKNLQYKRLAAAYTELYGFFFAYEDNGINYTQEIWAYIRQQRGEGCERDNRARVGPADALLDTAA